MAHKKRFPKNNKKDPAHIIPYGKQWLDASDIAAVSKVLRSDWLTQGPNVKEFENALARVCGSRFAVAVSNGTAALHLAYLAAGLQKNDEVITTPNTFVATTNMLLIVGAKPVFCDIRSDTWNIDEKKIEKLITPKTRAIAPVYFAGQPCNMDIIQRIARKHKLLVIADACHALGAEYKGKPIGTLADMSVLSFHPVKSITTGEGGAILTDNEEFYKKLLHLRSHGIKKDDKGFNVMSEIGYNYRLSDIQAALGTSQLQKLNKFVSLRRKHVLAYEKGLENVPDIVLPQEISNIRSAWHLYVILVQNSEDRIPLMNHLKNDGIGINFHYPAVYTHPYYRKNGYAKTALTNSDIYSRTAITLPLFPGISSSQIAHVVKSIKSFFFDKTKQI